MNRPVPSSRPVTAVVVTYQSTGTIESALAALHRGHEAGLIDCIIVDNGSNDGTIEVLERARTWATVVLTGCNNGFGRGCNIGFELARSPYVIFVNPDAVVEPAAVQTLLKFLDDHPEAGIAGPAIVEGEGRGATELQVTGMRLTPTIQVRAALPFLPHPRLSHPIEPGSPSTPTGWVCGAVLMIRTPLMRELGGFDPRFFLYWEETDLCKRAEDAGAGTWAVGAAVAHHVGGASSAADDTRVAGCIAKHYYQSRYYYMVKHHGVLQASSAELVEYGLLCLRTLGDLIRGRGARRIRPRLQAAMWTLPEHR